MVETTNTVPTLNETIVSGELCLEESVGEIRTVLLDVPTETVCLLTGILLVGLVAFVTRRQADRNSQEERQPDRIEPTPISQWIAARRQRQCAQKRKLEFLHRVGDDYGYAGSSKGFIDHWRHTEFPRLLPPIGHENGTNSSPVVYLDYAGSALPSRSQLQAIHESELKLVLGNPHSTGPAAYQSAQLIDEARQRILQHFRAAPGKYSGLAYPPTDCTDKNDLHPGYDIVFTSGATGALKLLAEQFPWSDGSKKPSNTGGKQGQQSEDKRGTDQPSMLVYAQSTHTSVVGMRGVALQRGARFMCKPMEDLSVGEAELDTWSQQASVDTECTGTCSSEKEQNDTTIDSSTKNLLVLPGECNFSGEVPPIGRTLAACRRKQPHWWTALDMAKMACTKDVDLKKLDPDFACVSFYKLFGAPTGIGALFVRRTAIDCLRSRGNEGDDKNGSNTIPSYRSYFGGGTVDVMLPRRDFCVPKSSSAASFLQHGTAHFRGISQLQHGFDEIDSLGGMPRIERHTMALTKELVQRFMELRHGNDQRVVRLYGPWGSSVDRFRQECVRNGPTVAFNILRSDGSVAGYNEVTKLAALHDPPIQLRGGCFCNPGACQEALKVDDDEIIRNYQEAGHVCGDDIDIVNGKPTGAIRASLGKESIWEDIDTLVCFIRETFVDGRTGGISNNSNAGNPDETISASGQYRKPRQQRQQRSDETSQQVSVKEPTEPRTTTTTISELYIYPIKSCAAQRVDRWNVLPSNGRLAFDREFALVDANGTVMRLQKYPKMSQIHPIIDPLARNMIVKATGVRQDDLILSINDSVSEVETNGGPDNNNDNNNRRIDNVVKVCGNKCGGVVWGDHSASAWFSDFLGVPCWLARHDGDRYRVPSKPSVLPTGRQLHLGFANEEALLLLSQYAVDKLNRVLVAQGRKRVNARFFRPNIVVRGDAKDRIGNTVNRLDNPEDRWRSMRVSRNGFRLRFVKECARCSMVDVDPDSGSKGRTLGALAEYRRSNGGLITFGVFVRRDRDESPPKEAETMFLQQGDAIAVC